MTCGTFHHDVNYVKLFFFLKCWFPDAAQATSVYEYGNFPGEADCLHGCHIPKCPPAPYFHSLSDMRTCSRLMYSVCTTKQNLQVKTHDLLHCLCVLRFKEGGMLGFV